MGFLRNTAESVMILAVSGGFGIYIGLGLLALVVALTVMGTTGVSVGPVLVLAAIGLGMLVIGGVSLAAIWKQSWAWLVIVNIVMLGVLVVTVCVSLVVPALALNVQDPVVEAVDRTWDSDSDPGGATRRELDTNKAFCEIRNGLPVHDRCESFYDMLHAAVAQDGCPLEAVDISSNCSAIEPETAEIEVFSFCKPDNAAGTGIPLSGQSLQHWRRQFYTACKGCSHDCKEEFIANVKVQLEPAAIAAICTFFFIVVTVFWNHFAVLEKAVRVDHELKRVYMRVEGIRLQGAMALNIIVGVAGLILLVLGYVSNNDAAELCPTGVECSPTYATVRQQQACFHCHCRRPSVMAVPCIAPTQLQLFMCVCPFWLSGGVVRWRVLADWRDGDRDLRPLQDRLGGADQSAPRGPAGLHRAGLPVAARRHRLRNLIRDTRRRLHIL